FVFNHVEKYPCSLRTTPARSLIHLKDVGIGSLMKTLCMKMATTLLRSLKPQDMLATIKVQFRQHIRKPCKKAQTDLPQNVLGKQRTMYHMKLLSAKYNDYSFFRNVSKTFLAQRGLALI
ncbi:hypothetical protein ACJX0J_041334, partial [Zea mays]